MSDRTIRLTDPSHRTLATARMTEKDGRFAGPINLDSMPADLLHRFEAYEEIVNGQMFGFLDEIEEEIGAMALSAAFDDGQEYPIEDLQIYPGAGRMSFKVKGRTDEAAGHLGAPATLDLAPHLHGESRNPA